MKIGCTSEPIVAGKLATMPTVISSEIPLPILRSVICSPIHIRSIEPPVRAATLSTHYQKRVYTPVDAADKLSCRPDFAMIIYPGYIAVADENMKLNSAIHVTKNTPPAFLVQAEDDPVHVENVIDYFLALKHAGIHAEMHIYTYGGHGYGLRPITQSNFIHDVPDSNNTPLPISHWPSLAAKWLHTIGILK